MLSGLILAHQLLARPAAPKIPDNVRYKPNVAYDTADPLLSSGGEDGELMNLETAVP